MGLKQADLGPLQWLAQAAGTDMRFMVALYSGALNRTVTVDLLLLAGGDRVKATEDAQHFADLALKLEHAMRANSPSPLSPSRRPDGASTPQGG